MRDNVCNVFRIRRDLCIHKRPSARAFVARHRRRRRVHKGCDQRYLVLRRLLEEIDACGICRPVVHAWRDVERLRSTASNSKLMSGVCQHRGWIGLDVRWISDEDAASTDVVSVRRQASTRSTKEHLCNLLAHAFRIVEQIIRPPSAARADAVNDLSRCC